ncbi:Invasion-inducing protein TIAM1/CDC24 and related RhoGEF GTPases [Ceraceosorus bombacis]|uniref:Invasion-inducing protein TIAM1/CDC24 and related RhoGEF GTPases n=1 Tax=Ceraceosorus bombacis TaxID=401625 RepID=A0A0P1BR18_9BASI|nr:Invasion-inducing protein TIAM1/CDC24 and related RhoGEF GTPases [Ceraceosorus bombacis]
MGGLSVPGRPAFGGAGGHSSNSMDGGIGSSLMSGPGGAALMSGAPLAANTIANKPAVAAGSLYQACLALRDRLWLVEGFGESFLSESVAAGNATSSPPRDGATALRPVQSTDVVSQLWQLFRLGAPLCALFNRLGPRAPLTINPGANPSNANECKKQVAKFIIALQNELSWDPDDCFTVTQLYLSDTNGFVKVVRCISKLLDVFEARGLLVESAHAPSSALDDVTKPNDERAWIVRELLDTERKYVQDLEVMQNYARALGQNDILPPDTIHNLFGNLNTLVDVNRRFLICIEENARRPPDEQHFGHVFQTMEQEFSVYEPFCANYAQALDIISAEALNIQRLRALPAAEGCYLDPSYELPTFLIKPVQRICKYPLLLEQLQKKTSPQAPIYKELVDGLQVIRRITDKVNETRRLQENIQILRELELRVEDWKGHLVSSFGPLLLSDVFVVSKSDTEREYHVYLFERILLCCKEILPNQPNKKNSKSNSLLKQKTTAAQTPPGKKPKTTLQLKGRIFMANVSGAKAHSKVASVSGLPGGSHALQVWWKGDVGHESFSLKCKNEEQLKQWLSALNRCIELEAARKADQLKRGILSPAQNMTGTGAGLNGRRSTAGSTGPASHFPQTPLTEVGTGFPFARADSQMSYQSRMDSGEVDYDTIEGLRDHASPSGFAGGRSTPLGGRYSTPAEHRDRQISFTSSDGRPRARTEDQDSSVLTQWRSHSPAVPLPGRQSTSSSGSAGASVAAAAVTALQEREQQLRKASSSRQLRAPGYPHAQGPAQTGFHRPARAAGDVAARHEAGDLVEHLDHLTMRTRADSTAHAMESSNANGGGVHGRSRSASNPMAFSAPGANEPPPPVPRAPYPPHLVNVGLAEPQAIRAPNHYMNGQDKRISSSSISTMDSVHSIGSVPGSTAASSPVTHGPSSNGLSSSRSTANSTPTQHAQNQHSNAVKLVVHYRDETFVVVVLATTSLLGLMDKLAKKMRDIDGRKVDPQAIRIRYIDDEGDRVAMQAEDDVQMAFDQARHSGGDVQLIVTVQV